MLRADEDESFDDGLGRAADANDDIDDDDDEEEEEEEEGDVVLIERVEESGEGRGWGCNNRDDKLVVF